jgi:sugar (pentulose or hexulose) kinase
VALPVREGCLVGIDVGSTRVKALVVDLAGQELSVGHAETPWRFTSSGAEAAPEDLYAATLAATATALAAAPAGPVTGVGVTGMAEALALLGARGEAVAPAIAWYDARGAQEQAELEDQFGAARFTGLTGLPTSTTASIVKLHWILRHVPGAAAARCALSVPEYVAHRLGGNRAAEWSLASRTGLFDVGRANWSTELLEWAALPEGLFPEALPAGSLLGRVADPPAGLERLTGAAIALGGHDHICASLGAGVVTPREILNSCGTAEAYVRSVVPLGPAELVAAVATGVGVGCHVIPGYQAILAGRPYGLVLGPVYDLLGWDDAAEAGASGPVGDAPGVDLAIAGTTGSRTHRRPGMTLAFEFDEATGHSSFSGIGPGVSAAQAKALAVEEMLRRSFRLYAAVERLGGPVDRVVMTGGWIRTAQLQKRKMARFPGACLVAVREPGARGAALFAGCAAGLLPGPDAFPAPPLEPPESG